MLALQISRHHAADLSSKEALRAHVDQLSPDKQREFIAAALQLIIARPSLEKLEMTSTYQHPMRAQVEFINH